jgi:2-phosphoglycerate kinase
MSAPSAASPWIVTLVCGASGVGKSSVAIPLSRRYGVPLAEADDIVTAVKALTTPEQAPLLHLWDTHPGVRDWTPARVVEHTIAVAEELRRGFEAVVADHIEFAMPVVLEGDYLLPDLVTGFGDAVRAVVISEPEESRIVANFQSREPGEDHRFRASVTTKMEAELSARAARVGVPVVSARPWSDSLDRVDATLRRYTENK